MKMEPQNHTQVANGNIKIWEIFYYLGIGVVFVGIVLLVFNNWASLNTTTRVIVTLGSGIGASLIGILLRHDKNLNPLVNSLLFVSGILTPVGLIILFESVGIASNKNLYQTIIYMVCLSFFSLLAWKFHLRLLSFFIVAFASLLFYTVSELITQEWGYKDHVFYPSSMGFIIGVSYLLLAYHFSKGVYHYLATYLNIVGINSILAFAHILAWEYRANLIWEIPVTLATLALIFISTSIKNRIFLVFGALYFLNSIIRITSTYFPEGYSWPIALIFIGLTLTIVGYIVFHLKNKGLNNHSQSLNNLSEHI